jgi:hypothetical protein
MALDDGDARPPLLIGATAAVAAEPVFPIVSPSTEDPNNRSLTAAYFLCFASLSAVARACLSANDSAANRRASVSESSSSSSTPFACPATAAVGLLLLLLAAEERDEGEEEEASLTGVLAGLGSTAGGGRRDRTLTAGFMGADGNVLVAIVGWTVLRAWMNMGTSRSVSLQFLCSISIWL